MGEVKRDCILYDVKKGRCRGLDKLYCARESRPCAFYKPEKDYRPDGSPKGFLEKYGEEKLRESDNHSSAVGVFGGNGEKEM